MKVFSFIGLGNMGLEMANHLINQKGVLVNIFDINKKTYNNFNQSNVIKLERIENLPKNTDYYFTMVPDGKILNKIVLGRNGIATKAKKGSIVIDCSSVDYATTINISIAPTGADTTWDASRRWYIMQTNAHNLIK